MGLLATTAQAGKITSELSASGAIGFGGWNEGNVTVIVNGTGSTKVTLPWLSNRCKNPGMPRLS